jgi:hypothetical protein
MKHLDWNQSTAWICAQTHAVLEIFGEPPRGQIALWSNSHRLNEQIQLVDGGAECLGGGTI